MKLIVESGSTKTDWAAVGMCRFRTSGINLSVMPARAILEVLLQARELLEENVPEGRNADPDEILFYGAGLAGSSSLLVLDKALKAVFPSASVAYGSDLLAAARAVFDRKPGIVAILGTGSNSCLYDGSKVVSNVRPGGFILGDEGGGVSLGRAFIADCIKGLLPESLSDSFTEAYGLTYEQIIERVYQGTSPAAFLASFVPFILEHRDDQYVRDLIDSNFRSFIIRCLKQYDLEANDVAVVGSFGCACREELISLGREYGVRFTTFIKSPIDRLVEMEEEKQKTNQL